MNARTQRILTNCKINTNDLRSSQSDYDADIDDTLRAAQLDCELVTLTLASDASKCVTCDFYVRDAMSCQCETCNAYSSQCVTCDATLAEYLPLALQCDECADSL